MLKSAHFFSTKCIEKWCFKSWYFWVQSIIHLIRHKYLSKFKSIPVMGIQFGQRVLKFSRCSYNITMSACHRHQTRSVNFHIGNCYKILVFILQSNIITFCCLDEILITKKWADLARILDHHAIWTRSSRGEQICCGSRIIWIRSSDCQKVRRFRPDLRSQIQKWTKSV